MMNHPGAVGVNDPRYTRVFSVLSGELSERATFHSVPVSIRNTLAETLKPEIGE
jgi:hypothetical protein